MRTITSKAINAFASARKFRNGNTAVEITTDSTFLVLHGHKIASKGNKGLFINLCGWNTPTTRERLNGLTGVSVNTKQGQAYLNGKPISSNGWVKV
jgi:DNA-binding cell septation regulator SpoVG